MRGTIVIVGLLLLSSPALADTVGPDVEADIPQAVYAERRAKLMKKLGDCVAAIKAFPRKGAGNEFDSYFYYLTGVKDAGSVLLLAPREKIYKQTLLFTPRDAEGEIWEGYREAMSPKLRKKYKVNSVGRIRGSTPRGLTRAFRHSKCYAMRLWRVLGLSPSTSAAAARASRRDRKAAHPQGSRTDRRENLR